MSLTAKMLKGLGLTDEQRESILEAHADTVNEIKAERDRLRSDADKLAEVQKELDDLKAAGDGGYKEKYEKEHKDFEDFKTAQAQKESQAAKEKAVRSYYESKGITGKNLDIAIRGSGAEIAALELDGGSIKNPSVLDELVKGTFSGLVVTTTTKGAETAKPPATTGGRMAREDIYKKDEKGRYVLSTAERQKALAEHMAQSE